MVKVDFNPAVNFKANETTTKTKGRVNLAQFEADADTFEAPKKKKTSTKDGAANIWKFFSVTKTMTGAAIKGTIYGIATSAAVMAIFWPFKALPKAFKKEGPTIGKIISHPFKHIGLTGKILTIASGLSVLGYQLVKGKLDANQNTAVIDHKLKIGHRNI